MLGTPIVEADFNKLAGELTDSPLRLVMIVNHITGLIYNVATNNKEISITYYNSIS